MKFENKNWIGEWENFELYIMDHDPYMEKCWSDAQDAAKNMPGFAAMAQIGIKNFWQMACKTVTEENSSLLGGWKIEDNGRDGILIHWKSIKGETLASVSYSVEEILQRGLEGKPNFVFKAEEQLQSGPFSYLLAMDPMPDREAVKNGGLLSHLHYQFASEKSKLIKADGTLQNPRWYATMCAKGDLLQRCNIVRALHRIEEWKELPDFSEDSSEDRR